ncbi:MAG: hypothetical protein L0387_12490 [Acidobacteria bacterium]|nr:hypothetical protein [Acidobacteriota bacterium]MCI0722378.1 hypothetical protein [Acidobacteriota bacterium]
MDVRESKFYYAGHDVNFAVFSDYPCRTRFVESITLPSYAAVEVYTIEPGANSQWIVVQQRNDGKSSLRFFVRDGETFRENQSHDLPKQLKDDILQRIPKSSANGKNPRAPSEVGIA